MRNLIKPLIFCVPLALVACGGGGGSGGDSNLQYSIKLNASKTAVPVNLSGAYPQYPGSADYYPYMSTLYVQAYEGGNPIVSATDEPFGCNVVAGLDSGSLFYLDGKDEHTVEVDYNGEKIKVPGSYRSITLGSNSGGNSFHVISKGIAGDVVVQCTITDPRDKRVYSAMATVKVGGGSTATPAGVSYTAQSEYLGSRDNTNNVHNQVAVEAMVRNDSNQPISNAGKPNLQVSIVPNESSIGARLMAGGKNSSGSMQVSTVNGIGQFSVASGPSKGVLLLQLTVDRADNDVSNGIQDAITQYAVIPVVDGIATAPLSIDDTQLTLTVQNGQPFSQVLIADGGVAPYTWTASSSLPSGLSLSASGLISGTPSVKAPGDFSVPVTVRDANGAIVSKTMVVKIIGNMPDTEVSFNINGCTGSASVICPIASVEVGTSFTYSFSATGANVTWGLTGAPSWMKVAGDGGVGLVTSGDLLVCENVGKYKFFVTAKNSTYSVTRQVSINVTDTSGSCKKEETPEAPKP
ncbi:MAG: putative Ig domain-containing protein [Comamonas sp.]